MSFYAHTYFYCLVVYKISYIVFIVFFGFARLAPDKPGAVGLNTHVAVDHIIEG